MTGIAAVGPPTLAGWLRRREQDGGRERHLVCLVAERLRQDVGQSLAAGRGPGLLEREDVGVKLGTGGHDVKRGPPSVDAGVQVERSYDELGHRGRPFPGRQAIVVMYAPTSEAVCWLTAPSRLSAWSC